MVTVRPDVRFCGLEKLIFAVKFTAFSVTLEVALGNVANKGLKKKYEKHGLKYHK